MRKYRSQVVRNTARSFGEIQLTMFEKYRKSRSDSDFLWHTRRGGAEQELHIQVVGWTWQCLKYGPITQGRCIYSETGLCCMIYLACLYFLKVWRVTKIEPVCRSVGDGSHYFRSISWLFTRENLHKGPLSNSPMSGNITLALDKVLHTTAIFSQKNGILTDFCHKMWIPLQSSQSRTQ